MVRAAAVLVIVVLLAQTSAAAPPADAPPSDGKRALAATTAVVPGVLVHGTGHFVAGEPGTGRLLLLAEGVGIGMVVAGGSVLFLSGASRYLVGPAAAVAALGVGVFGLSFVADMYGTLSTDGGAAERRTLTPPWMESELGYRRVADPLFSYEDFVVQRISMHAGALRFSPSAWFSLGADNARYRIESAYRLAGQTPSRVAKAGQNDHLDLIFALVHHRYPTEHFTRSSMELAVDGRYDLEHIGPTLRGAFVELGAGYARARIDYGIPAVPVPADADDLLLARFAFGVTLRGESRAGSEVLVYYDHRHDDFAAGLLMPGLGSGVAGHLGADGRWFFDQSWGVRLGLEVGASLVGGVSLLFRQAGAGPFVVGKELE